MNDVVQHDIDPHCEIIVCIPACNEAVYIERCLAALSRQLDLGGHRLDARCYEILILVNNTVDDTAQLIRRWQRHYPFLRLTCVERIFQAKSANVGTARRHLFEMAQARFTRAGREGIIATTDADTLVSATWLAQIRENIRAGAHCVAGFIDIDAAEFQALGLTTQRIIIADRQFRTLLQGVSAFIQTPPDANFFPEHYHHTAANLALTTAELRRCGGFPRVVTHEDIALIDALKRVDSIIAYSRRVSVTTSARMTARAEAGMGEQLLHWSRAVRGPQDVVVTAPTLSVQRFIVRAILHEHWSNHEKRSLRQARIRQISDRHVQRLAQQIDPTVPFGENWFALRPQVLPVLPSGHAVPITRAIAELKTLVPPRKFMLTNSHEHIVGGRLT